MSTPEMPDLRDQIARDISSRRNPWDAADAVLARVAPLLAAKDQENAALVHEWKHAQRIADRYEAEFRGAHEAAVATRRERDEARAEVERLHKLERTTADAMKAIVDYGVNQIDAELFTRGFEAIATDGTAIGRVRQVLDQASAWRAEVGRLNLEVMAHQVGDGYQKGHEHGSAVAVRYRDERDQARAERAACSEMLHSLARRHSRLRAEVDKLRATEDAIMPALKGLLPAPKPTDAELFKVGDVVFAVVRMVERLRADLAEAREQVDSHRCTIQQQHRDLTREIVALREERDIAVEVAERAARDTGTRHTITDVASDLTGLAAREATEPCWCSSCAPTVRFAARMHLCPTCGSKRCPRAMHHDAACTAPDRKPRRDERIDARHMHTEITDPGGA